MQINIKVIPRAHKNIIEKIDDTTFKIRVTVPPVDNKANIVVQKMLADYFNVSKSDIKVIRGMKSRQKVVEVDI
jgi:uncharacterized protein (TIGR00251 family)